jgi:predicted GH43/DUF377 family glycosyl hydrolase
MSAMANITLNRSAHNPIIKPDKNILWEAQASFNPSVIHENGVYKALYRALSADLDHEGHRLQLSTVAYAESPDGSEFGKKRQLIVPEEPFELFGCEDPRVTKIDDEYFIFYTAISAWPPSPTSIKVAVALSNDLRTVTEKHLVTPFNAKAMALFPEKINGQYVAILTVNTDMPPSKVALAFFDHKEDIWSPTYWNKWYKELDKHLVYLHRFNTDHIEVGAAPVKTAEGWVLIYSHIQNYGNQEKVIFGIEAALLDLEHPEKIIGRTSTPLFQPEAEYERKGMVGNIVFPSGALVMDDEFQIYYGAADTVSGMASVKLDLFLSLLKQSHYQDVFKFHKYQHNPILVPQEKELWQAQAVFNAGALYESGVFYMFYRAMSPDNTSTIGCALSDDGFTFHQPKHDPVYVPRLDFEMKKVPNGFSGCEDPRLTKIGDRVYMFYTAYDGIAPPQVALTSIKLSDLVAQRWIWEQPVLISDPTIDNKNACLFPEKINGKFVMLHRAAGQEIAFDYMENLDFADNVQLEREGTISPRHDSWDSAKIGIAGPPIKTEKGWLLIYHGVSTLDRNYRLGYMILDLNDPFHVLYRTPYPILEPEYPFEKIGIVNNVVFSCGAVEKDGEIFLYYGGADKVMAVATFPLEKLLSVL